MNCGMEFIYEGRENIQEYCRRFCNSYAFMIFENTSSKVIAWEITFIL